MKSKICGLIGVVTFAALTSVCWAGIPEPDVILYGTVTVDGVLKGAGDDVSVVARVNDVPEPVGSYHMGDDPNAGDSYVLRIRIEDLNDGSSQSNNAALIGQTIDVYVSEGAGPELLGGSLLISSRGDIQYVEYNVAVDTDEDGMPDYWENANGLDPNLDDSALDADDDDLSNIDEFYAGTAANNPDSDGDGMKDGWEVANLLDPLVNDAYVDKDGDGYTNLEEFLRDTLPGDSNSVPVAIAIHVDDNASFDPGPYDPCVSDPNEAGTVERPFDSIQEGIDFAITNDTVVIADGNYAGPGNRDIDLLGKSIAVMSADWATRCIIDCQNLGRGFYLHCGEDANSVIDGFTVTNGYADNGGAVYCQGSSPTLLNCILLKNTAQTNGGGLFCTDGAEPSIVNLTIAQNQAGNQGGAIYCDANSNPRLLNSILWANDAVGEGQEICLGDAAQEDLGSTVTASYSAVESGPNDIYEGDYCLMVWGEGNIDVDPCIADPNNDYHLNSQSGRWDPNTKTWVQDVVTSACIDAGDPNSDWTGEPWPHGKHINIGAYGGTPEASMSLSEIGNIANLDRDPNDVVDYADLDVLIERWCYREAPMLQDLNHDGAVDFADYAIFAEHFLEGILP